MSLSGRSTHGLFLNAERRVRLRRADDPAIQKTQNQQTRKLESLLDLSHRIGSDLRLEALLYPVAQKTSEGLAADRYSIFLYYENLKVLWTTVAIGLEGKTICLPAQVTRQEMDPLTYKNVTVHRMNSS